MELLGILVGIVLLVSFGTVVLLFTAVFIHAIIWLAQRMGWAYTAEKGDDLQKQIDDLKRELEEMKQTQSEPQS